MTTEIFKIGAVLLATYDDTLKETLKESKITPRAMKLWYLEAKHLLKLNPREADWFEPYKRQGIRSVIEKGNDDWHLGLWLFDSEAEAQQYSKELYDTKRLLTYIIDIPTQDDWDFLMLFKRG